MQPGTRKALDKAFSGLGIASIVLLGAALVVILGPIFVRGSRAFVFRATVEHRRLMLEKFQRGSRSALAEEMGRTAEARRPVYEVIAAFEQDLVGMRLAERRQYRDSLDEIKELLRELLGPFPGERRPIVIRAQYGATRWDRAQQVLHLILNAESYDHSDPTKMGTLVYSPRVEQFEGTSLEPLFAYIEEHADDMLRPRLTVYWRFLFDESLDAHMFGGIWPEMLGTIYLAIGAMLFAVPLGVISAIYLAEYAGEGRAVSLLRTFISTLAGVPSIVFGLFGLAFFVNTVHVSSSKSVLAGSLTLAVLILPTIIRASEEAIRAVPNTYREAALSLGASRLRTTLTVVLPAALPGVLTGIVISMGRAAGETAPIIFTAAVSVGRPLKVWQTLTQPTPALPWSIYNLTTEHAAQDEIVHVQYGMVLTLVLIVLLLNVVAVALRARLSKKLRG
ncbi:MAG: phosphate ABC transporter permease PstA [Verrucomicrobia bacterium]|nr:phosphate ABC transporter permease PstA [Verrucomicrobiota bacterium]